MLVNYLLKYSLKRLTVRACDYVNLDLIQILFIKNEPSNSLNMVVHGKSQHVWTKYHLFPETSGTQLMNSYVKAFIWRLATLFDLTNCNYVPHLKYVPYLKDGVKH